MVESENKSTSEARFPFITTVDIAMGRQRVQGKSFEIGLSSLFIAVEPVPPIDSILRLEIHPKTGRPLKITSVVTRARTRANGPDEPAGVEVSLTLDTDELLTSWRKFISSAARSTDGTKSEFIGSLVEDNLGVVADLTPEMLLNIYSVDIPRGFFFIETHVSRTESEIISVTLKGTHPASSPPTLNLHGRVERKYKTRLATGYQLSFIDLNPNALKTLWEFICSQTPSRYSPMNFPGNG